MSRSPWGNDLINVLRGLSRIGSAAAEIKSKEVSKAWDTSSLRPLAVQGANIIQETIAKSLQNPQAVQADIAKNTSEALSRISLVREGIKAYTTQTSASQTDTQDYDPLYDPNITELNIEELLLDSAFTGHHDHPKISEHISGEEILAGLGEVADAAQQTSGRVKFQVSERLKELEPFLDPSQQENEITEQHLQAVTDQISEIEGAAYGLNVKTRDSLEDTSITDETLYKNSFEDKYSFSSKADTKEAADEKFSKPEFHSNVEELSIEDIIMRDALNNHQNIVEDSLSKVSAVVNERIDEGIEIRENIKKEAAERIEAFNDLLDRSQHEEKNITEQQMNILNEKVEEIRDISYGHDLKIFNEIDKEKSIEKKEPSNDIVQENLPEELTVENIMMKGALSNHEDIPEEFAPSTVTEGIEEVVSIGDNVKNEATKKIEAFNSLIEELNYEEKEITEEHMNVLNNKLKEIHDISYGHDLKIFNEVESQKYKEGKEEISKEAVQETSAEELTIEDVLMKDALSSHEDIPEEVVAKIASTVTEGVEEVASIGENLKTEAEKKIEAFDNIIEGLNYEEKEITEEHMDVLNTKLKEIHDISYGHDLKIFNETQSEKHAEGTEILKEAEHESPAEELTIEDMMMKDALSNHEDIPQEVAAKIATTVSQGIEEGVTVTEGLKNEAARRIEALDNLIEELKYEEKEINDEHMNALDKKVKEIRDISYGHDLKIFSETEKEIPLEITENVKENKEKEKSIEKVNIEEVLTKDALHKQKDDTINLENSSPEITHPKVADASISTAAATTIPGVVGDGLTAAGAVSIATGVGATAAAIAGVGAAAGVTSVGAAAGVASVASGVGATAAIVSGAGAAASVISDSVTAASHDKNLTKDVKEESLKNLSEAHAVKSGISEISSSPTSKVEVAEKVVVDTPDLGKSSECVSDNIESKNEIEKDSSVLEESPITVSSTGETEMNALTETVGEDVSISNAVLSSALDTISDNSVSDGMPEVLSKSPEIVASASVAFSGAGIAVAAALTATVEGVGTTSTSGKSEKDIKLKEEIKNKDQLIEQEKTKISGAEAECSLKTEIKDNLLSNSTEAKDALSETVEGIGTTSAPGKSEKDINLKEEIKNKDQLTEQEKTKISGAEADSSLKTEIKDNSPSISTEAKDVTNAVATPAGSSKDSYTTVDIASTPLPSPSLTDTTTTATVPPAKTVEHDITSTPISTATVPLTKTMEHTTTSKPSTPSTSDVTPIKPSSKSTPTQNVATTSKSEKVVEKKNDFSSISNYCFQFCSTYT